MCVSRFQHLNYPGKTLLDQVANVIDETTNNSRSGQKGTPLPIFKRLLWPVVLRNAQLSPVIVYWRGYRYPAIRFRENMMTVYDGFPFLFPSALMTDLPAALRAQSLGSFLAARTLGIQSCSARCGGLTNTGGLGITLRNFVRH
jgi:hypothetical protein